MTEDECETCEDRDTCEYADNVPVQEIVFGLFNDGSVRMMSTIEDQRKSLLVAQEIIKHMLEDTSEEVMH